MRRTRTVLRSLIRPLAGTVIGLIVGIGGLSAPAALADFSWSGTLAVSDHYTDTYGTDCSGGENRVLNTSWALVPSTNVADLTAVSESGSGNSTCASPPPGMCVRQFALTAGTMTAGSGFSLDIGYVPTSRSITLTPGGPLGNVGNFTDTEQDSPACDAGTGPFTQSLPIFGIGLPRLDTSNGHSLPVHAAGNTVTASGTFSFSDGPSTNLGNAGSGLNLTSWTNYDPSAMSGGFLYTLTASRSVTEKVTAHLTGTCNVHVLSVAVDDLGPGAVSTSMPEIDPSTCQPAAAPASCTSICNWVFDAGSQVPLSAGPEAFRNWGGACPPFPNPLNACSVTMSSNQWVMAYFGQTLTPECPPGYMCAGVDFADKLDEQENSGDVAAVTCEAAAAASETGPIDAPAAALCATSAAYTALLFVTDPADHGYKRIGLAHADAVPRRSSYLVRCRRATRARACVAAGDALRAYLTNEQQLEALRLDSAQAADRYSTAGRDRSIAGQLLQEAIIRTLAGEIAQLEPQRHRAAQLVAKRLRGAGLDVRLSAAQLAAASARVGSLSVLPAAQVRHFTRLGFSRAQLAFALGLAGQAGRSLTPADTLSTVISRSNTTRALTRTYSGIDVGGALAIAKSLAAQHAISGRVARGVEAQLTLAAKACTGAGRARPAGRALADLRGLRGAYAQFLRDAIAPLGRYRRGVSAPLPACR